MINILYLDLTSCILDLADILKKTSIDPLMDERLYGDSSKEGRLDLTQDFLLVGRGGARRNRRIIVTTLLDP